MDIQVIDVWKCIDIAKSSLPKRLVEEIQIFGVEYNDEDELDEHLYSADNLLEMDDKGCLYITDEEKTLLIFIRDLQQEHEAFYFRLIN